MIVTATHGKIYRHDEAGLKALQAEHPDVYAKIIKIDEKKEEEKEAPKKAPKKAKTKK